MAAAVSASLDFRPTAGVLAAALAEFDELGVDGGGAVASAVRSGALEMYRRFRRPRKPSRHWRYDYAAPVFDDVHWSTGRAVAPLGLRGTQRSVRERAHEAPGADVPSLALENAGGLAHVGSLFLASPLPTDETRFTLACLADAKRLMPERVAATHQRIVVPHADRFSALSTAFQNCGAYVEIAPRAQLDAPLQLLWAARPGPPSAVFPHTVVRVGAGARATIVERHIGSSESFVAGNVEIDVAAGAELDYVVVQQTDEGTRLMFRRQARCAAGASIRWHLAEQGGGLVRSVVASALLGRHARADVNAVFFARGFEHVDMATRFEHVGSEAQSRAVVRGVAFDRAQARCTTTLRIAPHARLGTAHLAFDALTLSPRVYVGAKSPTAVGANGVSVNNAVTVGSLEREKLFYVHSRGIGRRDAEHMLALAFFEPAIGRFPGEALRDEVRAALDALLDEIPDTFAS